MDLRFSLVPRDPQGSRSVTPKRLVVIVVVVIVLIVVIVNVTKKSEPGISTIQGGAGNTGANAASLSTTTTLPTPTYPNGEEGDKDFAVQTFQEAPDFSGDIGGTIRLTNVGSQTYNMSFTVTLFSTANESGQPIGSAIGFADGVAPRETVTEDISSQNAAPAEGQKFWYQFQVNYEFAAN
jgi:hypothetical protein